MESNQGPRTERLTEASPPGRATEAHGDARAPLTTKPSSSSPSVGIKKAPTGRASSPSLSPRSIKPPPSRRPPSVASSSADGDNRKVPKPWWEALARLAFELRGEAAAQRAAHTTDLGILQQQQLALRARARIDKLQNAADSGGGGSTLALSGAALGAVASGGGRNGERRAGTAQPVGTGRCMGAPPPPPRLRSALLYAMWILSDPSPPSTLADRAQYGATPSNARHSASAVTRGCPRASRRSE